MLKAIDDAILELAGKFVAEPHAYFHERELHSAFYSLCVDRFPRVQCQAPGAAAIGLFRQEYDTVWRYIRENGYSERYSDQGTTACIDFVVLDPICVARFDFLTVVNKDERRRTRFRNALAGLSPIAAGIEFKMAHLRSSLELSASDISSFGRAMVVDARKLAHERIAKCYLFGFVHGNSIRKQDAWSIVTQCESEFYRLNPKGTVAVQLIAVSFDNGVYAFDSRDGETAAAVEVQQIEQGSVCWFEDRKYLVAGVGKECRILPLEFEDCGYFPVSTTAPVSQLSTYVAAEGLDFSRIRPQTRSKYLWDPPPGENYTPKDELQQPSPPRNVIVKIQGCGETSSVVDESGHQFKVFTRHLRHSRLN